MRCSLSTHHGQLVPRQCGGHLGGRWAQSGQGGQARQGPMHERACHNRLLQHSGLFPICVARLLHPVCQGAPRTSTLVYCLWPWSCLQQGAQDVSSHARRTRCCRYHMHSSSTSPQWHVQLQHHRHTTGRRRHRRGMRSWRPHLLENMRDTVKLCLPLPPPPWSMCICTGASPAASAAAMAGSLFTRLLR